VSTEKLTHLEVELLYLSSWSPPNVARFTSSISAMVFSSATLASIRASIADVVASSVSELFHASVDSIRELPRIEVTEMSVLTHDVPLYLSS